MLKRPSFFIAIAGIIAVTFLALRLRKDDPLPEPLVPASETPYQDSIGARGLVEGRGENVRIVPNTAGRVQDIFVKVGDRVKTGDPLFQLETTDAESLVRIREAEEAVAKGKLLEAEVLQADRADSLSRSERLREKNVVSEDEQKRKFYQLRSAESQKTRARADLGLSEAQLADARVQLDLLTVRAPREADVLQVNIREGEYATANAVDVPLLLGDTAVLQLRSDVDEDSASRLPVPCQAVAFPKGVRIDPIPLRFVRVEPYILPKKSLTGDSAERVDTRVLQVIFEFDRSKTSIYAGQQMDVFIEGAMDQGRR